MKEEISREKFIIIKFIRDVYIVNNLKVNLLIKINIFNLKKVIIDLL